MPDDLIAVTVVRKVFREKGMSRKITQGRDIPVMMAQELKKGLQPFLADLKTKFRSKRMRAGTRVDVSQTPAGASARVVIGDNVPFANIQAKWGSSPTLIRPTGGRKHLAIPLTKYGKGLQSAVMSLRAYDKDLRPRWYGKGQRGHQLYWKDNKTPHFQLVHEARVKPVVDLRDVSDKLRSYSEFIMRQIAEGIEFATISLRKG